MSNEELGFALIVGALCLGAAIGYLLVYTFRVDWFRDRLLSRSRGKRMLAMLPIMVPLYVVVAIFFSALRSH